MACDFSFKHYREILDAAKKKGYSIASCKSFHSKTPRPPFLVLRHDIELYPEKALKMARVEAAAGVKSTYFVRLHANEYNAFGFKTYEALKGIKEFGHEIGLHEEALDFSTLFNEDAREVLKRSKAVLEKIIGGPVYGVSSHSDFTGINNLELWKKNKPRDFGLAYAAYDKKFFKKCTYVSDSLVKSWKCYENGVLTDDKSCLCEHIKRGEPRLYALVHPRGWFHKAYHLR